PLNRLNGLLVFGRTSAALDEVSGWIAKLDVPSKEEKRSLWIYRPVNLSADSLAATLRSVFAAGGQGETAAPSPEAGGRSAPQAQHGPSSGTETSVADQPSAGAEGGGIRVGVNKDSNTLVIAATNAEWIQIQHMLDQLDRPTGQVMIEAAILEVTLTNELKF